MQRNIFLDDGSLREWHVHFPTENVSTFIPIKLISRTVQYGNKKLNILQIRKTFLLIIIYLKFRMKLVHLNLKTDA